ncbi:hypothetical protein SAMN06296241_2256 [Salinimicrobium sediminis]|uniref:DoxX protein n=2 Tax=Salinimicrobium sediminis TaxID=1343891 RepID=A0A285X5U0_9FLAO|nr:hypothetical protein SAMN06296241_2256 [Salinimicrobium sediminis]
MNNLYRNISQFRNIPILNLLLVNLRYMIGLGFLPSGMIKVLDKPFTRVENVGVFYDFLDALYTTGIYYNMIGLMQVIAAILLITQRFATLGSFLFLPIIFNITVLTISTIGSLTPLIALLMLLGIIFLLLWDYQKWFNIFNPDNAIKNLPSHNSYLTYNAVQLWTGVILISLPSLLIFAGYLKTGVASVGIILIVGNLASEKVQPVLRPFFSKLLRGTATETHTQKL